ncbi:hypothetical protein [Alteriqipengyuania lutimaris]|nr:hypothetical protein [Alteriqipengyuania lutimaris]MBB3032560.1 hypothetical protein [Alteriqipengyuania lutimaris]
MIAVAITFLLALSAIVALVSVAHSVLRGWHSYRALASELCAVRAAGNRPGAVTRGLRKASARPAPRTACRRHRAASGIRAAA